MVCGLKAEELFILNTLYGNRCVKSNRSFNLGQIANAFRAKFKNDPDDVAKELAGKYITSVRKKDTKYYISNLPLACFALNHHGYNATDGRILPGRIHRL